jgi:hypothetical protein
MPAKAGNISSKEAARCTLVCHAVSFLQFYRKGRFLQRSCFSAKIAAPGKAHIPDNVHTNIP